MRVTTLAVLVIFLITLGVLVESRRGGGFRGGSLRGRSTSSRSYSRNNYGTSRSRSSVSSRRLKTYAAADAAGYVVYGMTRYRRRYSYGHSARYYRDNPQICSNLDRYVSYDNGTVSRTQKLDFFVCPYDNSDADNAIYCCGPELQQYCCPYWKHPGRVAGTVIGIIIAAVFLIVLFCCCCKMCRNKSDRQRTPKHTAQAEMPMNPSIAKYQQPASQPYPQPPPPTAGQGYPPPPTAPPSQGGYPAQPYPPGGAPYTPQPPGPGTGADYTMQPSAPGAIGFESSPANGPPSYDDVTGYPNKQ